MNKVYKNSNLCLLVLALLLAFSVACTKKDTQYDTPEKVAKIFWSAIQNRDAATATAQVHEPVRSQLSKMIISDIMEGNVPALPVELKFEVEQNGDSAFVVISNSDGVSCSLIKSEGRWWVH